MDHRAKTIRLSKSCLSERERKAVDRVLEKEFLGMGPEVRAFEGELSQYFGGRGVVCVNTGTSALHLVLQSLGISTGDEVLVPSLTYVATYQAISATGATPVSCDVDLETAQISLEDAERKMTSKTKAIVPVHYMGQTMDLTRLYDWCEQHGLIPVEDAAHAFGTRYQGRLIGEIGQVSVFSFDGIKNITSGEGGAIVTSDERILAQARDLRLLGVMNDSEMRYAQKRSWDFDVEDQGWRYHMSEIMAAIGRVQLSRFEKELKPARQRLWRLYREELAKNASVKLFAENGDCDTVPHILPIRVLDGKRDALRARLLERGIQTGIHYKPNHLLQKYGGGKQSLPHCEQLFGELLTLPLHPDLTEEDVGFILDAVKTETFRAGV